jgi:hypothetical protein
VLAIRKTLETRSALAVFCLSVSALLSGCGGMGDDNSPTGASTSAAPGASTGTSVPTIQLSGTPPGTVVAGNAYVFQPTVQTTGGTATLSATGLPSWATINSSTGEISGTPTSGDVGTTSNIAIIAVDGSATASLPAFTIDVTAPAASTAGSASLSWEAPTLNTNGTALTDLAGYHIYYGTSVGALNSFIDVPGAATTEYEISNLSSGTYYFIVVAYNSLGFESPGSNQASKTI